MNPQQFRKSRIFFHENYDAGGFQHSRVMKVRADLGTQQTPLVVMNPPADEVVGGVTYPGIVKQPAWSPDSLVGIAARGASRIETRTFDPRGASSQQGVQNYPNYVLAGEVNEFGQQPNPSLTPRWSPDGTRTALRARPPNPAVASDVLPQIWAVRRNMSLPPRITRIGGEAIRDSLPFIDRTIYVRDPLTLSVEMEDPERDPITDGAFYLRLGMTYVPAMGTGAGTFAWTPPDQEAGKTRTVKFIATTPSGGTAYALVRIHVLGLPHACPFVDVEGGTGWTTENTVLGRSLVGALRPDLYRLKTPPAVTAGAYTLRLRENEQETTTLDQAALMILDHEASLHAYATDTTVVLGTPRPAVRVTTALGTDITALVTRGDSSFAGTAGDTLYVQAIENGSSGAVGLQSVPPSEPLFLTLDGKPIPCIPPCEGAPSGNQTLATQPPNDSLVLAQTGILVQAPDGLGGWRTVRHAYPRELVDDHVVDSLGTGQVRLIFLAQHRLYFVGTITRADSVGTPTSLPLLTADHSRLHDVLVAVGSPGDLLTTPVVPGDTLTMHFAAPAGPVPGRVRDYFLFTNGVYTSTPSVGPHADLETGGSMPTRFALWHGPNPFVGSTRIRFDLPQAEHVTLDVFTAQGRLVQRLIDHAYKPGRWTVEWTRQDARGYVVPAGVYVYRLQAGTFRAQRKIVVF